MADVRSRGRRDKILRRKYERKMFYGEKYISKKQISWEEMQRENERHVLPVGLSEKAPSSSSYEVL
jgi:hypothetical protein